MIQDSYYSNLSNKCTKNKFSFSFLSLLCLLLLTFDNPNLKLQPRSTISILVSVAAFWSPGWPLVHLFRLLDEFDQSFSANYKVHVCVDTNSDDLAEILASRKPVISTLEVRVWTLDDLGRNPEKLPQMHRRYWEKRKNEFDFFIYTEDDILFTKEAFEVYVSQRHMLQEKGWTFGWVRVETWGIDNETLVAIDNVESRADMTVFSTPDGKLWAEPWSPYTAHYVLDHEELRKMIDDPSDIWSLGFYPWDTRAKISLGYSYKFSGELRSYPYGARGWQSRALVPISRDCKVEQPGGIVYHMTSKYAKNTILAKDKDCIQGIREQTTIDCKLGIMPLSRIFLCGRFQSIPLPMWPEGAKIN